MKPEKVVHYAPSNTIGDEGLVISVNVSRIKEVQFKGKTVPTGIYKKQITDPVRVSFGGVQNDEQADLRCHGGPHKAVYVYGRPGYQHWEAFLGRKLQPGTFGENLTVERLDEDSVRIGDLLIFGEVILQVSEPRISCFKLSMTLQENPSFSKVFLEDGRVGFYTRVLREGKIAIGDRFLHQRTQGESPTVREFVRAAYDPDVSLSDLKFARNAIGLSPDWRSLLAKRASALTLAKRGKAWEGFRPFRLTRRSDEGEGIVSFYLAPANGNPIPEYLPGQHIVIQADIPGHAKTRRSYSLSSAKLDEGELRLTIKRAIAAESNDIPSMSNYLHASAKVGDIIDVRAPSGEFFVDPDNNTPIVLLAGGVGITALFSMFEALAGTGQKVTLIYAARNERERAFRRPIEELVSNNANLSAIFLSEEEFEASLCSNTRPGRIGPESLHGIDLTNIEAFICGPGAFLDAAEGLLMESGISEDRIHMEAFGARPGKAVPTHITYQGEHTVTFKRSGFEVQWTADKGTLLDLAEANGLRPPFACRAGTCQSCATRVYAGSLEYLELVDPPSSEETFVCCTIPTSDVVLDL